MNPQQEDRLPAAAGAVAEGAPGMVQVHGTPPEEGRPAAPSPLAPGGTAALGAMLAAIVRMAGASSGLLRVAAAGAALLEPLAATGSGEGVDAIRIAGAPATGAIARWCRRCPESGHPGSDCMRSGMCGRDDRFGADLAGWACKHVLAVPLRTEGRAAGALNLWFAVPGALAGATPPGVQAAADLVAAALEHDRRAREGLQASLVSERQMMANEVHDSLAQGLTYMRMRMSLLRDAVRQGDHVRAYKFWSDVDIALTHAHRRLRELITYFRSRMDPQGLLHALAETSENFLDRTGVALEFANTAPGLELPVAREVQVFHIVQEALANVCKHANARRARLTLAPKDEGYEIVVEDDGVGMDPDPAAGDRGEAGHYGIAIMRERARRLGGELTLDSAPGAGTRVRLYFPAVEPQTESRL